jgi:hypothetical protein
MSSPSHPIQGVFFLKTIRRRVNLVLQNGLIARRLQNRKGPGSVVAGWWPGALLAGVGGGEAASRLATFMGSSYRSDSNHRLICE